MWNTMDSGTGSHNLGRVHNTACTVQNKHDKVITKMYAKITTSLLYINPGISRFNGLINVYSEMSSSFHHFSGFVPLTCIKATATKPSKFGNLAINLGSHCNHAATHRHQTGAYSVTYCSQAATWCNPLQPKWWAYCNQASNKPCNPPQLGCDLLQPPAICNQTLQPTAIRLQPAATKTCNPLQSGCNQTLQPTAIRLQPAATKPCNQAAAYWYPT